MNPYPGRAAAANKIPGNINTYPAHGSKDFATGRERERGSAGKQQKREWVERGKRLLLPDIVGHFFVLQGLDGLRLSVDEAQLVVPDFRGLDPDIIF